MSASLILPATIGAVVLVGVYYYLNRRTGPPLPPGPPKHWFPYIGNTHQILNGPMFPILLAQWAEKYGPIFSYSVLGETTIVLTTTKANRDASNSFRKRLMDLRSTKYSSRPKLPLLNEFLCKRANIAFLGYGDDWRRHRKATHRELNVVNVEQFNPIQEREAYILTEGFLNNPGHENLLHLLQRFGGSIGMGAMFDHRVKSLGDPMLSEFSAVLERKLALLQPGASLYDYIPFAAWIPEFLMPSKAAARDARERGEAIDKKMCQTVQDRLAKGEVVNCFYSGLLHRAKEGINELSEFERDSLAGTLVGAAVAYICFPKVQKKLQEEIDRVVGRDRLPQLQDVPDLPYHRAFVREALRWRSPSRFSLPHATSEEDTYMGYYIPKGATVIQSSWTMEHNPEEFPEPEELRPERYLDKETGDLNNTPLLVFGAGRRVCPGAAMALSSMTLGCACLMWAFQFDKERDAQGNINEPNIDPANIHDGGNVFRMNPFPYTVEPRFLEVEKVVRQTATSAF